MLGEGSRIVLYLSVLIIASVPDLGNPNLKRLESSFKLIIFVFFVLLLLFHLF